MRKKEWQTPELEVLDIRQTAAGPGIRFPDQYMSDEDEEVHLNHS
jgi:hypothetical protein